MPGKRFSTKCNDLPGAIEFAEKFLKNLGAAVPKTPTLKEFSSIFFTDTGEGSLYYRDKLYGRDYSPARYARCQSSLKNYILPKFGSMLVTVITTRMIEDWLPHIKTRTGMPLANDSKNKVLIAFRLVMEEVRRQGFRTDNPAKDLRLMTVKAVERESLTPEVIAFLFPQDLEKRIKIWGGLMWAAYFSISYDTGMRPGEIAALRVCDVWKTPHGYAVSTNRSVNRFEMKIVERVKTSGKGYNERTGLIYDDTAELILRLIEERKLKSKDLLFTSPSKKNELLLVETSNKHFKGTLKKYDLYHKGLVQYCFRHTHTTYIRGDVSDDILAVSMGHTKLRQDYDHQTAGDLIRRLETERDGFFVYRQRSHQEADIVPLSLLLNDENKK